MRKLEDIGKWNRKITIVGDAPAAMPVFEVFDPLGQCVDELLESHLDEDGKTLRLTEAALTCLAVKEALRNMRAYVCAIPFAPGDEPKLELLAENIVSLVHQALHLGARVDWDHHKASREEAVRAPCRIAGIKSGEVRRERRTWTAHATKLMKSARGNDNELSNNKVAEEAFGKWSKIEGGKRPSFETMKSFVTELEKKGELPPKVKLVPKPRKTPAQFG